MPRGGKDKTRDDPERRCIATGEVQPKRGLIRFAVSPDGQIVADVLEKLPGRGIWVAAERSALVEAVQKRLFARALPPPADLPQLTKKQQYVWNILEEWRELPLQELVRLGETTADTVRRLEDKGGDGRG